MTIRSQPATRDYRDNWDLIFKRDERTQGRCTHPREYVTINADTFDVECTLCGKVLSFAECEARLLR